MIEKTRSRSKIPKPKKTPWSQKPHKPLATKRKFNAQDNPTKTYQAKHSQEEVKDFACAARRSRLQKRTEAELQCDRILQEGLGCIFEREKIIYYARGTKFIIVDFLIKTKDLSIAIEIDGFTHLKQFRYDAGRDLYLSSRHGIRTIRFTNQEILVHGPAVLEKIRELMDAQSL